MGLCFATAIVLFLNLPFGLQRARGRKFSWQWILPIRLPVPLSIALCFYGGFGCRLITFPAVIGAFFLGEFAGGEVGCLLGHRVNQYPSIPP
ncbi:MAG: hypothetical protein V1784_09780 [bacterium]